MNTERDTLPFKRLFDLNEAKGHLLAVLYYSSMSVGRRRRLCNK